MPRNTAPPAPGRARPRPGKTLTLDQVRKLPATCRVEDVAAALGVGRATAYELIADGTFPARVLPVGHRLKVVTASLVELLEARPRPGRDVSLSGSEPCTRCRLRTDHTPAARTCGPATPGHRIGADHVHVLETREPTGSPTGRLPHARPPPSHGGGPRTEPPDQGRLDADDTRQRPARPAAAPTRRPVMARHYSPPGTYERVRKSVLEDPSLTNAEFRLALYLATKPDRWVIHPRQLADALDRTVNEIETALRCLRRRGLVEEEITRTPDGRRIVRRQSRFRRDLILQPLDGPLLDGESAIQDLTSTNDKTTGQVSDGESAIRDLTCDDAVNPQVSSWVGILLGKRIPTLREDSQTCSEHSPGQPQSDLGGQPPNPLLGTGPRRPPGPAPGRPSLGCQNRAPSRRCA
jgi:hypothetical protein